MERLIEMKEVAEEENLVALKALIETAEKVLACDYQEALKKQVGTSNVLTFDQFRM